MSLLWLSGCASTSSAIVADDPYGTEQAFNSNVPCRFHIDGSDVAGGRSVTIRISDRPHTVVCKPREYKPKTEYINPPYGRHVVSFFFMVEDQADAPETWAEVHAREKIRERARSGRYDNYRALGASVAYTFGKSLRSVGAVAVIGFINRDTEQPSPLSARLQDEIIAGLVDEGVRIVKRDRLAVLIEEVRVQQSGLFNRDSAVKLGAMAGASVIVTGTYFDMPGQGVVQVKAEAVDVESGRILKVYSGELLRSRDVLELLE